MINEWNSRTSISQLSSQWKKVRSLYTKQNLLLLLYNVEGLNTHVADVDSLLSTYHPHVCILTGVGTAVNKNIIFPNYNTIAQAGTNAYGGVMILYQHYIKCKIIEKTLKFIIIELLLSPNPIYIGAIYVPPSSLPPFQLISKYQSKPFYLFGDYNAKHTNWKCKRNNTSGVQLQNWLETAGNEMITPTKSTSRRSESIIDFGITHDASGWASEVLNDGTSDHFPILFQSPLAIGEGSLFRKTNRKIFKYFLIVISEYWRSMVYNLDEQTFFSLFPLFLSSLWDRCSTYEDTTKYRPPWPSELVLLAKSVNKARRAYRRNKTKNKLDYYLSLREIFMDKRTHFLQSKKEQKMNWVTHGNNIWKFVKPSFHSFTPPFRGITSGNNKITDKEEIVGILANYFENHFAEPKFDDNNNEHLQAIEKFKQIEYAPSIPLEQITMNEVLKEWKKFKSKKSSDSSGTSAPGRPVQQFIDELDALLQNLHNSIPSITYNRKINQTINQNIPDHLIGSSQSQTISRSIHKKKKNYHRLIKRLKHKFRLTNTVIRKTDKSKVFHIGKVDDYQKKSNEYMIRTNAYKCLGTNDPLPDLIQRTNKYLLDLRLAKWITQKQYEQLCIKTDEVELAHLYYLPKAHKLRTPLRPIISGLKHPTIKISKFLDDLLRPLFDKMAVNTTVMSGFELIKKLLQWSKFNMKQETLLCTIDVTDLYTMIPQIEGVLTLKKMLDFLQINKIKDLKVEAIIRLARFVMQNNYFKYDGQYYHQVREGAMGSPLTLTIANCYMFFYQFDIVRQISNSSGLYFRFIDDIFIVINWPERHFLKQIDRWNKFDENIQLSAHVNSYADFLDVHIENKDGQLFTTVYHKPSYEPYYLPFNSIHPIHMKKNIPFAMLLRAIRYCSTFEAYLKEKSTLRMALILNKYPGKFIDQQFKKVFLKFQINEPLTKNNYNTLRQKVIDTQYSDKIPVDHTRTMFIHFTYCTSMKAFPKKFHALWNKYFAESPINEIASVLGTRNVDNLQRRLVYTRQY
ncbi:unnamed protein product [Rotaria sp. Silwood2]|nr:unnamed protein product [Rotaria sp. Silwood2]CAF3314664.1 unnamed protein product [Rotaria sp. Silwood2]